MKEVKFYCDRCGKEIGYSLNLYCSDDGKWTGYKRRSAEIAYPSIQQRERIIADSNNRISEGFDPIAMSHLSIESVTVESEYRHKRKTSELCPECYREFLQFMKGGKKDDSSDNSTEC